MVEVEKDESNLDTDADLLSESNASTERHKRQTARSNGF